MKNLQFARRWILIVSAAEAAGFAVAATVGVLVASGEPQPGLALGVTVAGGAVEGTLLGTGQWLAMRSGRPPAWRWILATAIGASVAWALGMTPSTLELDLSEPFVVVAVAIGAVVLLASIPVAQWLSLRRAGTLLWVPVNMGAWAVAVLWTAAPSPFIDETSPFGLVLALYVVAGLLMAVTIAVLTLPIARRYFGPMGDGTKDPAPPRPGTPSLPA